MHWTAVHPNRYVCCVVLACDSTMSHGQRTTTHAPCLGAIGLCGLLLLTACHGYRVAAAPADGPAHMVADKTTAQCLAQMQAAAQPPDGARVLLTAAAFAREDRLRIVPSESILDAAGQPASGRLHGPPESFRLTLEKGVCTMVREADARATALTACTCIATGNP